MARLLSLDEGYDSRGTFDETLEKLGHEADRPAGGEQCLREMGQAPMAEAVRDHRMPHSAAMRADADGEAAAEEDAAIAATPLPEDWLALGLPAATERLERALIRHTLAQTRGNRAEAARRLGIHRQLLYRKLAQYTMA
ncbi:hypothetical protein BH11PSE8_BH11PSE8_11850 [soil metagenome]